MILWKNLENYPSIISVTLLTWSTAYDQTIIKGLEQNIDVKVNEQTGSWRTEQMKGMTKTTYPMAYSCESNLDLV